MTATTQRPAESRGQDLAAAVREILPAARLDAAPTSVLAIQPDDLEAVVHRLAALDGARLTDLFATDSDQVTMRLIWALDPAGHYLIIETPVIGETYPALSDLAPAAFLEECETYEQFGIRPATDKPLNRVALPPHADHSLPRLGHAPATAPRPSRETHAAHVVGGHAFEFPVGPVRATAVESLYYGLVTSGEEIVDLYLMTWHKHRGAEWRLRGRTPEQALFHIERLEGLCAVGNAWAFANTVEAALSMQIDPAAARSRAVALEMERLYNHTAAMAALCQSTGLAVGQAMAEIALERLLRMNAAVFGHRYLFGVIALGGVHRAPDADALRRELPEAYGELRRCAHALLDTNSFLDRLEATGTLTGEVARRFGLVGPIARATGITLDTRYDHPGLPYGQFAVRVATEQAGDALARLRVMLAEAAESVRLLPELLDIGTSAAITPTPARHGAVSGLGTAESARGESPAWIALDPDGRLTRVRLRPASARNWRAFDDAARSQNVFTDIPIIEASFWLTVAGTAR